MDEEVKDETGVMPGIERVVVNEENGAVVEEVIVTVAVLSGGLSGGVVGAELGGVVLDVGEAVCTGTSGFDDDV